MAEKEEERGSPLPLGDPPLPGSAPGDPTEIPKKVSSLTKVVQALTSQLNRSIEEFDKALSSKEGEASGKGLSDLIENLGESDKEKLMKLIREKTKEKLEE